MRFFILLVTTTTLIAQSNSHPAFWRYSHPKAKALIGVDVKAIVNSPLGQKITQEFSQTGLSINMSGGAVMGLLASVDRVLISSPVGSPKAKTVRSQQPPVVIAVSGKFDLPQLRKMVGTAGRPSFYKGVEIHGRAGDTMSLGFVSPAILLIGERPNLQAAIDHHASAAASALQTDLFTQAAELSNKYDLWFVSDAPPAELANADLPPQLAMFRDVETTEGGVSFRNGLALEFGFLTKTPEAAKQMASAIQALVGLAAMGNSDKPEVGEMLRKLQIVHVEDQVTLAMQFSQAEMDRAIESAKSSAQRKGQEGWQQVQAKPAVRGNLEASAVVAQAPSEPPKPLVVKIFNAEGGTKEIPISKQ